MPISTKLPHTTDLMAELRSELADERAQALHAQRLEGGAFVDEQAMQSTAGLVSAFLTSYWQHRQMLPLETWLALELDRYGVHWENEASPERTAREIIATIEDAQQAQKSLNSHLKAGSNQNSWLANEVERGAAQQGNLSISAYASAVDGALLAASEEALTVITTRGGTISQAMNLDGFIAEQHHVATFNINATSEGSTYRARVLSPELGSGGYRKNSMDIGIYDETGKLVRRYQSKYGKTADATDALFDKGDYRGQRRLVPEGHGAEIANASESIEIDGIRSNPLSKEEAKRLQDRAQTEHEARRYEWSDTSRITVAKEIGKHAFISAGITAGLQGVRLLGRRAWNGLVGNGNPPVEDDLKEFLGASLKGATDVGVQVAVSGALVVAVKNGLLLVGKATPAAVITHTVNLGLENLKCLWRVAEGEISAAEAIDDMAKITTTTVAALAAGSHGMAIGAAIGTCLGPIGMALGGFVGGVAAGMAGSSMAKGVYEGGKQLVKAGAAVVARGCSAAMASGKKMLSWARNKIFG